MQICKLSCETLPSYGKIMSGDQFHIICNQNEIFKQSFVVTAFHLSVAPFTNMDQL